MKIRLLSDLHMEGFEFVYQYQNEDVLVLAGDIHTRGRHRELLNQIPHDLPILMVAGNHEYYRGEFYTTKYELADLMTFYPNLKVLDNSDWEINGVEFFGGTMFTDFDLYGDSDLAQFHAIQGIADFMAIAKRAEPESHKLLLWTTDDHIAEHRKFCHELEGWFKRTEGKTRVVISHFVPHEVCIHPKWGGRTNALNPYFTSNMERYMGLVDLWLCGHTHDNIDKKVAGTKIIANPRGYGNENPGFDPNLIIEV